MALVVISRKSTFLFSKIGAFLLILLYCLEFYSLSDKVAAPFFTSFTTANNKPIISLFKTDNTKLSNQFTRINAANKSESKNVARGRNITIANQTVHVPDVEVLNEILNISQINYSVPIFKNIWSNEDFKMEPGQCSTCAVVLSSGYLLKTKAGALIDAHDCVFRFNVAPVKGYESIVGSRTTVRLAAHSVNFSVLQEVLYQEAPNIEQSVLFFYPPHRQDYISLVAQNISLGLQNTAIKIFLAEKYNVPYFQRYFTAQTGRYFPPGSIWITTGFVGTVIALKTCDTVTIFGAVQKHHCDSELLQVLYHYYDQPDGKDLCTYIRSKPTSHEYFQEHSAFVEWGKRRKIGSLFPSP